VTQYARANEITVDEARKRLEARSAKFAEGQAHRFRDTFAVERCWPEFGAPLW